MFHPTEVAEVRARYGELPGLRASPTGEVREGAEQQQQASAPSTQGGSPAGKKGKRQKGDKPAPLSRRSSFAKIEFAMQTFHDAYAEAEVAAIGFSQGASFLCILLIFADMVIILNTGHSGLTGARWSAVAGLVMSAVASAFLAMMAVPPLSPWKATMTPLAFFARGTFALFQILQLLAANLPLTPSSLILITIPFLPVTIGGFLAFRYILIRRQLVEAVHQTHKHIAKV